MLIGMAAICIGSFNITYFINKVPGMTNAL